MNFVVCASSFTAGMEILSFAITLLCTQHLELGRAMEER